MHIIVWSDDVVVFGHQSYAIWTQLPGNTYVINLILVLFEMIHTLICYLLAKINVTNILSGWFD